MRFDCLLVEVHERDTCSTYSLWARIDAVAKTMTFDLEVVNKGQVVFFQADYATFDGAVAEWNQQVRDPRNIITL